MQQPSVFQPLDPDDPLQVGGYRILARLGAGGMGRVYLGTTQAGRPLAIKVIRPEFRDDPEFRRRFQAEVHSAERVQNFYTAPVIDADLAGPQPWLATAHVPGPSLGQAVADLGPLPEPTVRVLGAGVAEALLAIHRAGLVHRDLKPTNVLLAADGPRVIDFGIARAVDATPLTRTGVRIGSPQFMAPEQALGQPATPAVDVFAFGSLLYFAATGRTPFGEGPDSAVLYRIVHETPDLTGCPESLRDLIADCLDKDPVARPAPQSVLDTLTGATGPQAISPGWLPPALTTRLDVYRALPQTAPLPPGLLLPPGSAKPGGRSGLLAAIGSVVVAVAVSVAVTAYAMSGGSARPDANAVSQSPVQQQSSDPAQPVAGDSPTDTATDIDTDTPAPDTPAGTQLDRYHDISLTYSYGILFNEDPKHPFLCESQYCQSSDFTWDSIGIRGGDQLAVLPSGATGSYERCRDDTQYTNSLSSDEVSSGTQICVTTSAHLIGLVKINAVVHGTSDYLRFDLTVWQG